MDNLTAESAAVQWRCFHCDETFTNRKCAGDHFGADENDEAACQIKGGAEYHLVRYIRSLEEQLRIYRDERDPITLAWEAKLSDHGQALIRAEESGYNKGVRDMSSEAAIAERIAAAVKAARVKALREALAIISHEISDSFDAGVMSDKVAVASRCGVRIRALITAAEAPAESWKGNPTELPIHTCGKCGAKAVAFNCSEKGCPVNGGAYYG